MASLTPMDAPMLGSSAERWLVAAAVMASAMMELIDTAAVNVSLPYIGGSLAATASEATWVLTSYLISNAIVLPLAGWLAIIKGIRHDASNRLRFAADRGRTRSGPARRW